MPRRLACRSADERADLRDRLGARAALAPTTRSRSRGCSRRTAATSSTCPQVRSSPLERPAFGRSYQTPFADRIRNEAGIPTIAVGAISSYDDVNTIICAGRADLCALARPHLYDPAWTLHAAAEQEFDADAWVPQYQAGSRKPPAGRDRVRAELERTFDEVGADLLVGRARLTTVAMRGAVPNGEPLQPQDLVITLLGTYVRPFGRPVWSGGLVMLLREFGFSDGAARAALTRLVRRSLIARARSGRLVHYRADPAVRAAADRGRRAHLHARPICPPTSGRGPCSGTRSRRIAGSSGPGSAAGCGSSVSARCRTASGSRPTTTPPRSSICSGELGVADRATVFLSPDRRRCRRRPAGAGGAGMGPERARERYDAFCSGFEPYLAADAPAAVRPGGVPRPHEAHASVPRVRPARPRAARGARAAVGAAVAGGGDLRGALHRAGGGVAAALRRGHRRGGRRRRGDPRSRGAQYR